MKTRNARAWWAPLLILAGIVAACQQVTPTADAPTQTPAQTPAEPQASCYDSAITLLDRGGADIHGAIVADTLHMGGATAPATCSAPVNQSLAGLPDDRAAQAQQSRYYLIVIRYPGGNRLYVLSLRSDGTSCVVNTDDECIARVTDLPDDFDLEELPDDVAPIIPAGRPAPPTAGPSPGDDTPPAPGPAPGDDTPPAPSPPPGDGAPPPAAGTAPGAAGSPQPRDGATSVSVDGPLLSWSAGASATSYELYWGTAKNLAADAALGTPVRTTSPGVTIRRPGETAAERRLAGETTYYWRVDATNDVGTTTGSVWSFTTGEAPAPPPAPEPAPEPAPRASRKSWTLDDEVHFGGYTFETRSAPEYRTPSFVWDEITEDNRECAVVSVGLWKTPIAITPANRHLYFGGARQKWTLDADVSVGQVVLVLTSPPTSWFHNRSNSLMWARRALDGKLLEVRIDDCR